MPINAMPPRYAGIKSKSDALRTESTERAQMAGWSTSQLIRIAGEKDTFLLFYSELLGSEVRAEIAATLFMMQDELEKRLLSAPKDSHGMPIIEGVHFDPDDPLAGWWTAIPPFSTQNNEWATYLGHAQRNRYVAKRRIPPPRPTKQPNPAPSVVPPPLPPSVNDLVKRAKDILQRPSDLPPHTPWARSKLLCVVEKLQTDPFVLDEYINGKDAQFRGGGGGYGGGKRLPPAEFNKLVKHFRAELARAMRLPHADDDRWLAASLLTLHDQIDKGFALALEQVKAGDGDYATSPFSIQVKDWIVAHGKDHNSIYSCYFH